MYDHWAQLEDYRRIMRGNTKQKAEKDTADSARLDLIEKAMQTPTRELSHLAPKPQPLLTEEEWDTLHMRAEVEALANATSDAERLIITQRLQRQYGEKVKEMIKK